MIFLRRGCNVLRWRVWMFVGRGALRLLLRLRKRVKLHITLSVKCIREFTHAHYCQTPLTSNHAFTNLLSMLHRRILTRFIQTDQTSLRHSVFLWMPAASLKWSCKVIFCSLIIISEWLCSTWYGAGNLINSVSFKYPELCCNNGARMHIDLHKDLSSPAHGI